MADEKTIYKMKTPDGNPVRVEEAWKDANGELLTEKVNKADAQTITGLKTFATLPQSSATPSNDSDLATKKYSDDSWATRKAQEEKCYQALKTVTKGFTRTDPVHVRIGEDGEPEIHYTMTQADGSAYFREMDLGKSTFYLHHGDVITNASAILRGVKCKEIIIDSLRNATNLTDAFLRWTGSEWLDTIHVTLVDNVLAEVKAMPSAFSHCIVNEELEFTGSYTDSIQDSFSSVTNDFTLRFSTAWQPYSFYNAFSGCTSLTEIPAFDMSNVATDYHMTNWLKNCKSVKSILVTNLKNSCSIADCTALDRNAILVLFNNLADLTGKTSATLTIGSTLGAKITDEDRAIVTNKNWNLAE